jgi:hypothetical protein
MAWARDWLEAACRRNRVSIWFLFFSAMLTATAMRPSFASLSVVFMNLITLLLLRASARIEGRHDHRSPESPGHQP